MNCDNHMKRASNNDPNKNYAKTTASHQHHHHRNLPTLAKPINIKQFNPQKNNSNLEGLGPALSSEAPSVGLLAFGRMPLALAFGSRTSADVFSRVVRGVSWVL